MKDLKIYIGVGSILLAIYLIVQYNKPKPVDWTPTYAIEDKIPYGTFILHERIQDLIPKGKILQRRKPVYNLFVEEKITQASLLIIAGTVNLDKYDYSELVKFMQKGNSVFIATFYFGDFLKDTLNTEINSELKIGSKKTTLYFSNPVLKPLKKYNFDKDIGNQYFSKFDSSRAVVLGMNNHGNANFLKYQFGKGALYLISSPQLFSNYNVIQTDGAEYASKALSYLPPNKTLIWDEFQTLGPEENASRFGVLLRFPELRWAYYLSLLSLVLFVLYTIKRRQRVIPVVTPLANTSLDFVKVVGQVYYEQRDHKNLATKQISYFLDHIRTVYRLNTQVIDAKLKASLSSKSGISVDSLDELFLMIEKTLSSSVLSDQQLIELNQKIENFYKKPH